MCWGSRTVNIQTLSDLNRLPIGNTENGIPTTQSDTGYLPSDRFHGSHCLHDADARYYSSPGIPSPYLTDGSRNPGYYKVTSPSSSNNCLADFDGRDNTDKIIAQRGNKDYSSWKPNTSAEDDYPSASCCDMFHTDGTRQGDWYLPACGELGYTIPPFNKINDAITEMRNAYGSSVGFTLDTYNNYWTSSEYSIAEARSVGTNVGAVSYPFKFSTGPVRAFLRVNADGVVRN